MKIVIFQGGVGNQLFQYYLYRYLHELGYNVKALNFVNNDHNGLEIITYFDVKIDFTYNPTVLFLWKWVIKLYRRSIRFLVVDDNHFTLNNLGLFYLGYWQHKRFEPQYAQILFKDLCLNKNNTLILDRILSTNSVSIHVRRGDYLTPQNSKIFGGICDKAYYMHARDCIEKKIQNPQYFIFSNDIQWCVENLPFDAATYIDWNQGNNSIYDMYLMSKCKANIIANSTFSYWAAKLACNDIVVYPKKWFNHAPAPDIFNNNWIGL